MARSKLNTPVNDLIGDSGAVLWSLVKGEQLEFPISLPFLQNVTAGYKYEAVVVEGANEIGQPSPPTAVQSPAPVVTPLVVRVPFHKGPWQPVVAYNREDLTKYEDVIYKLKNGVAYISAITPDTDPNWEVADMQTVFLQFHKQLADDWVVKPSVGSPSYGFFELRVTEPADSIFSRTWKPVRGMVEIHFSPTYSVDD